MLITGQNTLEAFLRWLDEREYSAATVEKYLRDVTAFAHWLDGKALTKEAAARWKSELLRRGNAPATVNAALAALGCLFRFLGREDCRVKSLKLQRRAFRDQSRERTQDEYAALVDTAHTLNAIPKHKKNSVPGLPGRGQDHSERGSFGSLVLSVASASTVRRISVYSRCHSNNSRICHPAIQDGVQIDGIAIYIEDCLIAFAEQRFAVLIRKTQILC